MSSLYDLIDGLYTTPAQPQQADAVAPPVTFGSKIKDEGANVATKVETINFVGSGVSASRNTDGSVTVTVPGVTAGSESATKVSRTNGSGVPIPQFSVISELLNGQIAMLDPSIAERSQFSGIAISSFAIDGAGEIQLDGLVVGALSGLGFQADESVFISTTPGAYGKPVNLPSAAGTIMIRIGIARNINGTDLEILPLILGRN